MSLFRVGLTLFVLVARVAAGQDSALKNEKHDDKSLTKPAAVKPASVKPAAVKPAAVKPTPKHTPHIVYVFDPILAAEIALGVLVIAIPAVVFYLRRPKKHLPRALPADAIQVGRTIVTLENEQNVGARREQEDAFGFSNVRDRALIDAAGVIGIVADGMGGLELGAQASNTAVRTFLETASTAVRRGAAVPTALTDALDAANQAVVSLAANAGLERRVGTTIAAVVVGPSGLSWIAAGDTRIYLFRDGQVYRVNADHVLRRQLARDVAAGTIDASSAAAHPQRDAVTSFLGAPTVREMDRSLQPLPLRAGDRVFVCTDGVHGTLNDTELANILSRNGTRELARSIVGHAVARHRPEQDNLTVISLALSDSV